MVKLEPPSAPPTSGRARIGLTRFQIGWAAGVGFAAILLVVGWVVVSEIPGRVYISSWSFSMPGILLLAAALLVARWVGPRLRERLFDHRQLLLIYLMVCVSGLFAGYSLLQTMLPALGGLTWQAQTETSWQKLWPHVPHWLVPMDREATRGMFVGDSAVPWGTWIRPLAWWFLFLMAAYAALLCLAILLSRQWIERERLTFPIAHLPLEMAAPDRRLFRNRLFWIGFVIPAVLESLLALNYYYPNVPAVVMKHRDYAPDWFPDRPYSALRPFVVGWTPFIVAFAYLAPVDVQFSIWFFALALKLMRLYAALMGMDAAEAGAVANRFPFREEQALGAFMAYGMVILWRSVGTQGMGRLRSSRGRTISDAPERRALLGFILCSAITIGFMAAAGMPLWAAAAMWAGTVLIALVLARVRAEAGPAWVFGPYRDVGRALCTAFGTQRFSPPELVSLGAFRWLNRDPRFLPMPFHMEALKVADTVGLPRRVVVPLMLGATAVGVAAGFYAVLALSYKLGLGTSKTAGFRGGWVWTQTVDLLKNPLPADTIGLPWLIGAAAFTGFLMGMRTLFLWWPFHAIGYVTAETGVGNSFWFHYLLAWVFKGGVLRYGGHRLYVQTMPFIFGVMLGDILTQTIWSAGASLLDLPVYQFVS